MKKILLVDDTTLHLEAAKSFLESKYEIITARSGKEALKIFAQGIIPDLVLLDILMPEMDGWETFNYLRGISLLRDVPIAFLTSLDNEIDKNYASRLGAVDFISKPFKREELVKRVDSILESHLTKNSI